MSQLERLLREQLFELDQRIQGEIQFKTPTNIKTTYTAQTNSTKGFFDPLPIRSIEIQAQETIPKGEQVEQTFTEWRKRNDTYGEYTHIQIGNFELVLDGVNNKHGFADVYMQTNNKQQHPKQIDATYNLLNKLAIYSKEEQINPSNFAYFPRNTQTRAALALIEEGIPFSLETVEHGLGPSRLQRYELTETPETYTLTRTARMARKGIIRKGLQPQHIKELDHFVQTMFPTYNTNHEWKLEP